MLKIFRMRCTKNFLVIMLVLAAVAGKAQPRVQVLDSAAGISLRGLSVVSDQVFWASGSKGTVARSTDGGKQVTWLKVPGYENRDFRDIEAFDDQTAVIMAIAEPALLLKTTDGGKSWKKVFEDSTHGMFLDAMHFSDARHGIVVGDPINGHFFLKGTADGGDHWDVSYTPPAAAPGEACFASSGTNIWLQPNGRFRLVSGGTQSHYVDQNGSRTLPLVQGKESTGANTIAAYGHNLVVLGGDFTRDKDTAGNSALSTDDGSSWHTPQTPPHGYRSCVVYLDGRRLAACGTSGVDISADGGMHWQLVTTQSFHVVQKAKKGKAVFLAGSNGKIAVFNDRF
jgi:photosystem II stability/assembly factor-like uncharacterized protein